VASSWSTETWLPARGRPILCRVPGCRGKASDETTQLCRHHRAQKAREHNERRRRQRAIASLPDLRAPGWAELGACFRHGAELFFAEDRATIKEAKAVCAGCDVRAQCLAQALEWPVHGIWGGTTREERETLKTLKTPAAGSERPLALV
jgi:hypothetical protein